MRRFAQTARAVDVAREAAIAGGAAALSWWRKDPPAETKSDASPVSQADRDADEAILSVIRGAFPEHDILSEETGVLGPGTCDCRWIVDPLDGTRGFLRGDVSWGPLVALEHQGDLVAAVMHLPVPGVTYWATRGGGTYRDGERLRVSGITNWRDATLVVGVMCRLFAEPYAAGVLELVQSADRVRCPGDLAGSAMILDGRGEVWLEAGVREWDLAAPRLLIEEAGGRCTDFQGRPSHVGGVALGGNHRMHAEALGVLRAC